MRVAFLTYSFSMHINIKAKYFNNSNDYVYLFAANFRHKRKEFDIPIEYRPNIHVESLIHEDMEWGLILKNTLHMYQVLRQKRIQVLHIIDMAFAVYGITLGALGVKIVLENNGSDVILAPDAKAVRNIYKWAYKLSRAVVQDSQVAQRAGIRLGARKDKNEVIELGIDTTIFNPSVPKGEFKKKYNLPEASKIIFSPRTLRPLCNISEIIDTINLTVTKYPDVYYIFCSSTKNKQYENRISEEHLGDHVIFLGYVDNEKEMPYIYRDSEIVISIPNSDSSPRSVYEAMACGSNVIVSDLPWIGDKFKDGKELFIIPLHDKIQLQSTIDSILSGKKRIDENTEYRRIRQILDYRIARKQLKRIYFDVIKGKRK